ncbi:MAG: Hint domain-containing protein, partial [Bacteroidota bacterium]
LDEVINGIIPVIPTNAMEGFQNTSFSTTEDSVTIQIPQSELSEASGGTASFTAFLTTECFLAGTKILTDKGEIAVEELSIGDLVQTAEGILEPIRWIGKQTVEPNRIQNPLRGYPILIKAGALGKGLPYRDLYTSPDHAYLVDGLLINAGALVNDISIIKTEPTETFYYYHVELENHSLLIAEGTPAESFYPNREDRLVYDNGAEYDRLYPYGNSQLILYPLDYPRISSKNKVPGYISEKLLQIAEKLDRSLELVTARS